MTKKILLKSDPAFSDIHERNMEIVLENETTDGNVMMLSTQGKTGMTDYHQNIDYPLGVMHRRVKSKKSPKRNPIETSKGKHKRNPSRSPVQ